MEIREGLLYAKSHEWVKEEGDVVTIGLTDYAQSELGDFFSNCHMLCDNTCSILYR